MAGCAQVPKYRGEVRTLRQLGFVRSIKADQFFARGDLTLRQFDRQAEWISFAGIEPAQHLIEDVDSRFDLKLTRDGAESGLDEITLRIKRVVQVEHDDAAVRQRDVGQARERHNEA